MVSSSVAINGGHARCKVVTAVLCADWFSTYAIDVDKAFGNSRAVVYAQTQGLAVCLRVITTDIYIPKLL